MPHRAHTGFSITDQRYHCAEATSRELFSPAKSLGRLNSEFRFQRRTARKLTDEARSASSARTRRVSERVSRDPDPWSKRYEKGMRAFSASGLWKNGRRARCDTLR